MKLKKILKTTVTVVTVGSVGIGVGILIAKPELRKQIVDWVTSKCGKSAEAEGQGETASPVSEQQPSQPQTQANEPRREGRNNGGYYKPRYNNNHNNNKD